MKTRNVQYRPTGSVLVTTLVLSLLVGLAVAALLFVAQQQNTLTARSMTWSSEIPLAEAGIEEAMTHINMRNRDLARYGWTFSGTNYYKTRVFSNGYFYASISDAKPPRLVSIGYGRIPLQTNYTSRKVMALTKVASPVMGIVSKTTVTMNGNAYVDSYDSSSEDWSTDGQYDPNKRRDRAGVGSTSSLVPAIATGGTKIYGFASTAPGGTVTGNVGDGQWLSSNSGLQPDHVTDDFNMAIPDATLPSPWAPWFGSPGIHGGVPYDLLLNNKDYHVSDVSLTAGEGIYVIGKVRLYIEGRLKMAGSAGITLHPNAELEIYVAGDIDITGKGILNPRQLPSNCSIYGLPTCRDVKLAGDASLQAIVYAPQADVKITGNADFYGSFVGNTLTFSGTGAVHYDEALAKGGPEYKIVLWEEL